MTMGSKTAQLNGLVLAGGKSRRMGRDKGSLTYGGETATSRLAAQLDELCGAVFISNRAEQQDLPGHQHLDQVHDRFGDIGPMGGLLSAMEEAPGAAWLVVACDMPLLDAGTLRSLVQHRDPAKLATVFRTGADQRPEPLCAIYEPSCRDRLLQAVREEQLSLRDLLRTWDVATAVCLDEGNLGNVNTPEAYEEMLRKQQGEDSR